MVETVKKSLVLTAIGDDRPGLVEMLAAAVAEHGGNWEASRMARLGGKFAGIALVTFGDSVPEGFTSSMATLADRGLLVTIADSTPISGDAESPRLLDLELVGNDRAGILREISRVLATHQVNVEELGTMCESAPMSGGELFRLRALLSTPAGLDIAELEGELEALSAELMVEVSLADGES